MEKIAILLPRQTILEYARNVLEQIEVQLLNVVENANAVLEAQNAAAAGVRVIIARGLQATLIKENTSIPVVEMPVTVREIGLMILKAKGMLKKEHPSIGFVAFANMFQSLKHLGDLFDCDIRLYELAELEETRPKVSQAIAEGVDLIIGGVKANQIAFEIGFPSLFIETGEESIRNALDVAIRTVRLADKEKQNEAQMETLLDTSFSGIIKINAYKEIVTVNRVIEQMLGKTAEEIIGFPLNKVIDGMDADSIDMILNGAEEMYSTSFYIGEQLLMVIGAPIQYDGHFSGAILTCHKIRSVEKPSAETARLKSAKGYIAHRDFGGILRDCTEMKKCIQLARSYAVSKSPVLICGETGTEREIMAESIHNNSIQKSGPFININCGTLSAQEQKEAIFGIFPADDGKRNQNRKGAMENAAYGTILLQEVDRLSYECQYLLYKAVRDKLFWRNDSMIRQAAAVRVIVSTRKELAMLVRGGAFREDLYYLLSPLKIELPPLRSHRSDISKLAERYLHHFNTAYSRYVELSKEAYQVLEGYSWEGNLLQLECFCERLVLTSRRRQVEEGTVQNLLQELYPMIRELDGSNQKILLKHPEAVRITELLERHNGNRLAAAGEMGISTTTLWRKMKKYGIGSKYEP